MEIAQLMVGSRSEVKASVIVPTLNRAGLLRRCLTALARQTYPQVDFEVLVIDNGSTDHTRSIAQEFASVLQLTCVVWPELGLHSARHAGMRSAKADILMFTDDDTEAEPSWVEAAVGTFECNPEVAIVGGNNYPIFEETPPEWLMRLWEKPVCSRRALPHLSILDFGEGIFPINPRYVWGCNFAVRKDVLLKAGGFHPDGFPDGRWRLRGDGETHVADAVRRMGQGSLFNSKASIRHAVPKQRMTKEYFRKRSRAQGISDSYTAIRNSGPFRRALKARVRKAIGRVKLLTGRLTSEPDVLDVLQSNFFDYWDGFELHRNEVRKDPELMAWVLKETYL
jgi:glucosyl-dolichyl phosphate glucuronosyltransferase